MDETVPAAAVNVVLVLPEGTVTDAGTTKLVVLELSVTATPLLPAAELRFTVHVAEVPALIEVGLHESKLTVTGGPTVTVPPVPVAVMEAPAGEAPKALLSPIEAFPAPAVSAAVTTAITPLPIVLELIP